MIQLFFFGASTVYGVGAENAGWVDLLKQRLHKKMFAADGIGEKYEAYNFGQPGAGADFVLVTAREQLKFYRHSGKVIAVVSVGMNNAKAINKPDNFAMSVEEYERLMSMLLERMKEDVDATVVVGYSTVDESKTNPKPNPITSEESYFTNDRLIIFNHALMKLSRSHGVGFVDIGMNPEEWSKKYLYRDGLHPNQAGHEYIAEKVWAEVEKLLDE